LEKAHISNGRESPNLAQLEPLDDISAAIVDGWRAEATHDWVGLQELEDRLEKSGDHHPLFFEAMRLRITWRIETGDRSHAAEALDMIDSTGQLDLESMILRIRVALLAEHPFAAISTLEEIAPRVRRRSDARALLALLDEFPKGFQPNVVERFRTRLKRTRK
jgi:hypothetical protein